MGLFDAFKKKDNGSEATLDSAKQLRVKFGTKEPIPFVDSETGVKMELRAFGNAIFAVQDTSAYQSEEQAMEKAQELCVEELVSQINRLSGHIKVTNYSKIREEFMMTSKERLKQSGLLGVVDLGGINLTDESQKRLKEAQEQLRMAQDPAYAEAKRVREEAEAMQEQMAAARAMKSASSETVEPVKAASADGSAMPVTGSARPKFCPNCGTPSGTDKFCRNCGHAFGA